MNQQQMIFVASYAIEKGLDYETLKWSHHMRGNQSMMEDVYGYVVEGRLIGPEAFREKYKDFEMYCS